MEALTPLLRDAPGRMRAGFQAVWHAGGVHDWRMPMFAFPDGMLAVGVPARIAGEITGGAKQWVETNPETYRQLARRHAASVRPVPFA
jgi:carbonic anhydrase/acetyltransferase-like protein (isoleucine patch superfamily)